LKKNLSGEVLKSAIAKAANKCKKDHRGINYDKKTSKSIKNYNKSIQTFGINRAKWSAAEKFAIKHNMRFMIITEQTTHYFFELVQKCLQ